MLNNIRTILLNTNGKRQASSSIAGDEYIPPYTAVELPERLKVVDHILFGGKPDYEGRVYRITQYMKIMHGSGYEDHILTPDPRITYDPHGVTGDPADGIATFENSNYDRGGVAGGNDFTVLGTWDAGGADGRVVTTWKVAAVTSTSLLITNDQTKEFVAYDSLGGTKVLPGSTLRLAVNTQPLTANKLWTVSYRSRPQPDIGNIVASLQAAPNAVKAEVFGTDTGVEPVRTYHHLFTKNPMLPQQLTGFLLAYARRLNLLRVQ